MSNKKKFVNRGKTSAPARERMIHELSSSFKLKSEAISEKINDIIQLLHKTDPLNLMNFLAVTDYASSIGMTSEIGYSKEQILKNRAIEYIQSVLVSTAYDPLNCNVDQDKQEDYFHEIQAKTIELYGLVDEWYLYWSAHAETDLSLNSDEIEYITESQLFSQVRGKRYQVQLAEHLQMLISPFDDLLQKNYSISAKEVIDGLLSIEHQLTHGRGEAFAEIQELMMLGDLDPDTRRKGEKVYEALVGNATNDVGRITAWPQLFLERLSLSLGESNDFTNDLYEYWPSITLPIERKPFIKIGDDYYCFAYYNLFDNVYRIIQKIIIEIDGTNRDTWEQVQKESSEESIAGLFKSLLPGCNVYSDNYYPQNKSLKRMYENDIIITYQNSIFIIEAKAGAFSSTPALTDFQSHIKSYKNLVEKADQQCQRTLSYLKRQPESPIYFKNKQEKTVLKMNQFNYVYTFCVTIDDFNEFAAKAEKLNKINIELGTIVLSIEDLRTYKDYFESPFAFLHFIEKRKKATQNKALQLTDELDHLGLYIEHNDYPDMVFNLKKNSIFQFIGYRESIDEYFMGLWSGNQVKKPEREINSIVEQLLYFLQTKENKFSKNIKYAEFLLDLSSEEANQFSQSINSIQKRQFELSKTIPAISINKNSRYVLFIDQPDIKKYPIKDMFKYCDGMLAYGKYSSIILINLKVDSDGRIIDVHFYKREREGIPQEDMDTLIEYGRETFETKLKSILKVSGKKKIGRNDPCPCGSGLKYKKCCGR